MPASASLAMLAMQDMDPALFKEGMGVIVRRPDAYTAHVTVFDSVVFDVNQSPKENPPNVKYFRVKRVRFRWLHQRCLRGNLVLVPANRKCIAMWGKQLLHTELKITPATAKELE
jgi:hypothetical protein